MKKSIKIKMNEDVLTSKGGRTSKIETESKITEKGNELKKLYEPN